MTMVRKFSFLAAAVLLIFSTGAAAGRRPVIVSFDPTSGPVGTQVTIRGQYFSPQYKVYYNRTQLRPLRATKTSLIVQIPQNATRGRFYMKDRRNTVTSAQIFNVTSGAKQPRYSSAPPAVQRPQIRAISPASAAPGATVVIKGVSFSSKTKDNVVKLSGARCKVLSASETELTVEIPSKGIDSGRFSVDVKKKGVATWGRTFHVLNPPRISGFSPKSGTVGTEVSVGGFYFGNNPQAVKVVLNGVPCRVKAANENEIRFLVPRGAVSGSLKIVVSQKGSAESKKSFKVVEMLGISRMSPETGLPGTTVTLIGTGFNSNKKNNTVHVGSQKATILSAESNKIVFKIPGNIMDGKVSVRVKVKKRGAVSAPVKFDIFNTPEIKSVTPARVPSGGTLTISGSNFGTRSNHVRVLLNGKVLYVRNISPSSITATLPRGARSGKIIVKTVRRGEAKSNELIEVYVPVRLTITDIMPSSGPAGSKVTITGAGFNAEKSDNTVRFGNANCKILSSSANTIVVEIPEHSATSGRFFVEKKGGGSFMFKRPFYVINPPWISEFTPKIGPVGTNVSIGGHNFGNNIRNVRVTLNGKPCHLTAVTDNEIRLSIPRGSISGNFKILVHKHGDTESKKEFEVLEALEIQRVEPNFGMPGTKIKIWGSGFKSKPQDHTIYLGKIKIAVKKIENQALIFNIPEKIRSGNLKLKVKIKGRGAVTAPKKFTVGHAPVIKGFSPSKGPAGSVVTIKGGNFGTSPKHVRVYIGKQGVYVKAVTPDSIRILLPRGVVSGPLEVRTVRRGKVVSKNNFEVIIPVKLYIAQLIPPMAKPGAKVTIKGSGFSKEDDGNTVMLQNITLKILKQSAKKILVEIPEKAPSGYFTIKTDDGKAYRHHIPFRVLYPPKIESFVPTKGPVGTKVLIVGEGFGTNPRNIKVTVGERICRVYGVTDTRIKTKIPTGSNTGKIKVTIPQIGSGVSEREFVLWEQLNVTQMKPRFGFPGDKITLMGIGFKPAIKDGNVIYLEDQKIIPVNVKKHLMTFKIPDNAPDGKLSVKVKVQGEGEIVLPISLQVVHKPVIESFSPKRGRVGTQVEIKGKYFAEKKSSVRVYIGKKILFPSSVKLNSIIVNIPPGAKSGKLAIQTPKRGHAYSSSVFDVYSPVSATHCMPEMAVEGQKVTIMGNGFETTASKNEVTLNGKKVKVLSSTSREIKVEIPAGASSGFFNVTVPKRGSSQTATEIRIVQKLVLDSFSPSDGIPGTKVTIKGKGFMNPQLKVLFGDIPVIADVLSSEKLSVIIPNEVIEEKFYILGEGVDQVVSKKAFKTLVPLSANYFEPVQGLEGTLITIHGEGFDLSKVNSTKVYYGNTKLTLENKSSDKKLKVRIPKGADVKNDSFKVIVRGKGEVQIPGIFEIIRLSVKNFKPQWGSSGTNIRIYGTAFDVRPGKTSVIFDKRKLGIGKDSTEDSITVTIPKGANSSKFIIKVKGRGSVTTDKEFEVKKSASELMAMSSTEDTISPDSAPEPEIIMEDEDVLPPTPVKETKKGGDDSFSMDDFLSTDDSGVKISNFEPKSGVPGDIIEISGSGFGEDADNVKAWIGNTPAAVFGALPDMIMIEVPEGASDGKVIIKVGDNSRVKSKKKFKVQ